MTLAHERYVSGRFDAFQERFRPEVAADDYRLAGILGAFGVSGEDASAMAGLRILDIGCGKGRFARRLMELGAEVVGLDASLGMLKQASGLDRVRASALRLPFASGSFDGVMAVEVFEHLPAAGVIPALQEIARVLKSDGVVAIVDKSRFAMDRVRPWLPRALVKWIDERRGLWMYPAAGPVREQWFSPWGFSRRLCSFFDNVEVAFLLSPEESRKVIFRRVGVARGMVLWTGRSVGFSRCEDKPRMSSGDQTRPYAPSPSSAASRHLLPEGERTASGLYLRALSLWERKPAQPAGEGCGASPRGRSAPPLSSAIPQRLLPEGEGGRSPLPILPLLLWRTPLGLEQVLSQEGIPFRVVDRVDAATLRLGRFILFDARVTRRPEEISSSHTGIDVDALRRNSTDGDPFAALIDNRPQLKSWTIGGHVVTERVSRFDKATIRRRVLTWVRSEVERAGGIWARIAAFPDPYRSAFNLRVDLDEPYPEDYLRFAAARRPIDDCSTAFVSTAAYEDFPEVLGDLRRVDTQSHGHYHHIYRSEPANRRNLTRAGAILRRRGLTPTAFAAPGGRWNPGLDRVIESLGYEYSSDFHLGYDDLPFFPIREGTRSPVLQVPVHPICEGLFLDAGCDDPSVISRYLIAMVRAKIAQGEPAFVYGHPERRLGRFPQVVSELARAVSALEGVWRVTLTEFARWWRFRLSRSWSLTTEGSRGTVTFESWSGRYPLALEILRGDRMARVPLMARGQSIHLDSLAFEHMPNRRDLISRLARSPRGLRHTLREALDWETVTPVDDLPDEDVRDRLKKRLRRWREEAACR